MKIKYTVHIESVNSYKDEELSRKCGETEHRRITESIMDFNFFTKKEAMDFVKECKNGLENNPRFYDRLYINYDRKLDGDIEFHRAVSIYCGTCTDNVIHMVISTGFFVPSITKIRGAVWNEYKIIVCER